MAEYVPAGHIAKRYVVSYTTLRKWARDGRIGRLRPRGTRSRNLYRLADVEALLGKTQERGDNRAVVGYARVSSAHQTADLQRQIGLLRGHLGSEASVLSDTASGINFHRAGLQTLLERVCRGMVKQVVVTHRDRVCRFAYDLFKSVCDLHGVSIVVLGEDGQANDERELADDLLAVTTVFVARHNGRRAALHRRMRRAQGERAQEAE
jgi:predicted site-specific integrase-resolvase